MLTLLAALAWSWGEGGELPSLIGAVPFSGLITVLLDPQVRTALRWLGRGLRYLRRRRAARAVSGFGRQAPQGGADAAGTDVGRRQG